MQKYESKQKQGKSRYRNRITINKENENRNRDIDKPNDRDKYKHKHKYMGKERNRKQFRIVGLLVDSALIMLPVKNASGERNKSVYSVIEMGIGLGSGIDTRAIQKARS